MSQPFLNFLKKVSSKNDRKDQHEALKNYFQDLIFDMFLPKMIRFSS